MSDSFLSAFDDLVDQPEKVESHIEALSFSALLNPPLLLQTNEHECGGQLWPAGMVLGEYIIKHRLNEFRGKSIVELGAGSGLVGLAIARGLLQCNFDSPAFRIPPTRIALTDGLAALVPLMRQNINLNDPDGLSRAGILVEAFQLEWGKDIVNITPSSHNRHHTDSDSDSNSNDMAMKDFSRTPDVILAADCAYLEDSFPLLLSTLQQLMTAPHAILYFCYKKRRKRDKDCMKLITKAFSVVDVRGEWEKQGVWMYEITMKSVNS